MKMDRNTVIGFVLLAGLLFVYLYTSTKSSHELQAQRQRQEDSIARVKFVQDSVLRLHDTTSNVVVADSGFRQVVAETPLVVENDVLKITFSNKGGQPKSVELKKYKSGKDSQQVVLGGTAFDKFAYRINTGNNQAADITELFFQPGTVTKNADGSQLVSFQLTANGQSITHQFVVRKEDYMIDWNVQFNGADQLLEKQSFNLVWQSQPMQHEADAAYEKQQTTIDYIEDGSFDYMMSKTERKLEKQVQWVSVAQQFFNTTLVAKNGFTSGDIKVVRKSNEDTSSGIIANVTTTLQAQLPVGKIASMPLQLYYGPNDYKVLKHQAAQMDKIVNLGRDMYAFVRPINKYIVMPVFDFFKSFVGSFGLVIALLTLFIRLLTSPLVYTSYLSGAKMKALRPEIDKLKEKYNNDQQQVGVEQMKLFREAGVNPLGGCIPALLQIPIFFALYSFFNSNISLRGEEFLWAHNLASYDVLFHFPFNVWGLGNHLSLFTLTAVITSFLISLYNMNMTPDQNNPALKYMPYIFPFILLFVFNRLPAALTWYYTVSNLITLILQFIIQNYIIDHDKILAKIQENRSKPKSKSKWQERLEQMQETQRQAQQQQAKGGRK